jgi:hypothetical protein
MGEEIKKVNHKNLVIGIIVIAIIIVILFIPMIPVEATYSDTEPYEETETYTEPESYEREATYVVDDRNLEEKLGFLDFYVQSDVTVRNTDKYGGTFVVVHNLYDVHGLFGTVEDSFYLGAGESYTSTTTFDTSWGQDTVGSYDVTPPTVIDTRLLEKTRVVQKTRVVEKTKTVYKSIIEILIYG